MTYLNREGHAWASCRTTGNPLDKAVIVFIGGRMNKHWAAFPGKAEIARATEIAEATVVKCIRRLELGGHLIRVAFAATNGADQKIGYVLAGCGRPLDSLDDEFLALAFADRKQPGVPRVAKPQHWSGERKGGRVAVGHPPRVADGYPPGGCGPPLEEKEHTEDQIEQEDTFGEAAFAAPSQKQAAIAEVRAGAPTPNRDHEVVAAATIPTQRQLRDRRSPIQQRDDDWAAQIAAADYGTLQNAIDEYGDARGKLWKWAQDTAGIDMGVLPGFEWEGREEEQYRAAYLWLLKKHADDDTWLDMLLSPLDHRICAPEPDYEWFDHCATPPGLTNEAFAEQMRQTIRGMSEEEWGPQIVEIRHVKSGIWAQCRTKAKDYLRGRKLPVEAVSMNIVAMQFAVNHYESKGKWPTAIVPSSLRSVSLVQSAPSWAA